MDYPVSAVTGGRCLNGLSGGLTLCRALAAVMVIGPLLALVLSAAFLVGRPDLPGEVLLGWLLLLVPLVFGVLLWRGQHWAIWVLRVVVLALIAGALWLHLRLGIPVLADPEVAIPLLWFLLFWLALSFRCRAGEPD